GTAGQRCTSTRRIFMHKSIAADLTQRLVKAYQQMPIGNPMDEGVLMGPLVNERAVDNMFKALEVAQDQGGEILTGGERVPALRLNFVAPTSIRMPKQTSIACDETFA